MNEKPSGLNGPHGLDGANGARRRAMASTLELEEVV